LRSKSESKPIGVNEVGERLHAVDGNNRDALAISPLELRVPTDVGLFELERDLDANLLEDAACCLAEMTPAREVEPDAMH
jgi:hypothetical protein